MISRDPPRAFQKSLKASAMETQSKSRACHSQMMTAARQKWTQGQWTQGKWTQGLRRTVEVAQGAPRATKALLSVVALFSMLHLGVALVPAVQREAMRTFHTANASVASWLLFQLRPAMYSFENEVFVSAEPIVEPFPKASGDVVKRMAMNHGSMQVATWWLRRSLADRSQTHFTARSRFRGVEVKTRWRILGGEGLRFELLSDEGRP